MQQWHQSHHGISAPMHQGINVLLYLPFVGVVTVAAVGFSGHILLSSLALSRRNQVWAGAHWLGYGALGRGFSLEARFPVAKSEWRPTYPSSCHR